MIAAAVMVAQQVGGRATRDAMFLTSFPVTSLPRMMIASAVLSIVLVLTTTRWFASVKPDRIVPAAFGVSAALMLALWGLSFNAPALAAIGVFLHVAVLGPVLASAFWVVANERFDPRSARRDMGPIGAVGAIGGLAGGLAANRLAPFAGVAAMLPVLAVLHVVCAFTVHRLAAANPARPEGPDDREAPDVLEGLRVVMRRPQLRNLAAMILLGTLSAAFLDYVLKARARAVAADGPALMQFFSTYHTVVSLATLVVQAALVQRLLHKWGPARTAAVHPAAVAAGSVVALAWPGLPSVTVARATDSVLGNSVFRSAYEVLFNPIVPHEKRSAKAIVEVGFERAGDALGGALVAVILLGGAGVSGPILLGGAAVLSSVALWIGWRLRRGYVDTLESSLIHGAETAKPAVMAELSDSASLSATTSFDESQVIDTHTLAKALAEIGVTSPSSLAAEGRIDPELQRMLDTIAHLRSGNPGRIRAALAEAGKPGPELVPHLLPLLERDDLAAEVVRSLREAGRAIVGQLVDTLVDPESPLAVRRRIPRILAVSDSPVAVEGLFVALEDPRFDVRYQCGRALARLLERGAVDVYGHDRVFTAVMREVAVEKRVWEGQREMALGEEAAESPFVERYLQRRADRSLEHVFTLLSLALPAQPLQIAFRGLQTHDSHMRGTALEYLESVLPHAIREGLWPFLEDTRAAERTPRPRERVLEELLSSNESIRINLEELRHLQTPEPGNEPRE